MRRGERAPPDSTDARLGDRLDLRYDSGTLVPEMVGELRAAGMEIGGHTLTHPILLRVSDAEVRAEIAAGLERPCAAQ